MPFKNKEQYNDWKRELMRKNAVAFRKLKEETPCSDCEQYFPYYVMDFDHVPERGPKVANISTLAGNRSINAPAVQRELVKCDVVCANCHKIRTHERGQNGRKS